MTVLADLGNGLTLERIAIADLREQDINAHVMSPAMFQRLVENIKRTGRLESTPFCARIDGKVEIVSGHHRIRAARAAGLVTVDCLVDSSSLRRSAIVAKQLAHNALVGRDDMDVVRRLVALIDTPDDRLETGLDAALLMPNQGDAIPAFVPAGDFQWKTVSFVFLPHQLTEFKDLIASIQGQQELIGVAEEEQFEPFLKAASTYARIKDVRNIGTVITLLTRLAQEQIAAWEREQAEQDAGTAGEAAS